MIELLEKINSDQQILVALVAVSLPALMKILRRLVKNSDMKLEIHFSYPKKPKK